MIYYKYGMIIAGIAALIGIGLYSNWQTAACVFVAMWSNNVSQRKD